MAHAATSSSVRPLADFPAMLGRLRRARGLSQLGLALAAEVSQRHVSFLETGRTRPSREMVGRLAAALDLALKDENALLLAAGFAPAHGEHAFGDEAAAMVRRVTELALAAHAPFPAFAVDRAWRPLSANGPALALFGALISEGGLDPAVSLLRAAATSEAFRGAVANWSQLALHFLALAEAEAWRAPPGPMRAELDATIAALLALTPEGARLHAVQPVGAALIMQVRTPALSLDLVSTVAQFGAPHDTAADDLRIEFFYPADAASEAVLRRLAKSLAQT
ncbi:helix-turn-helix domain-containing protein [Phenylobacterium sp.]|uniref:helix-turn-helix domain-containing protein n=1 Tax=Phenylobacterium sp. TaxID=1871053 RepID=UPI0027310AD3|nr:helix-turn-helix domain-containing protein [Phenylobacterium sp.]MDP1618198.1 helix-turn-helix domain-containing protein [Phenylobacterium sp.]MDP1988942.1 helix-turn-helix domain-containing protein [Phenylobacterium sp.]